ncbi:MAG: biphenyl 2,3-dioxygenase [Elusimicrobia bacterium]|nr:MAG: biphenyl 2,3-dioxygenase [Elusimicrobiota bacterium]
MASVCKRSDVPAGGMKIVEVGGVRIAICDVQGTLYAIQDVCTHDDAPLGEGSLEGDSVVCSRHGGRFDVKTGAATQMPAIVPVKTFKVLVDGDDVSLEGV